jgi:microcin C transport system ATP-binding protein
MTSLNPLYTLLKQVNEVLRVHKGLSGAAARARALELLRLVGLPEAERRLGAYPHQLSGGERQRVMIAMALANEPDLLIADEPTTALDVTIQAQILALLKALKAKFGMALLLITHDLTIVRRMADRVSIMTQGEIVEAGPTAEVFEHPCHAYTRRLLAAQPQGSPAPAPADAPVIIEGRDLKVWFPIKAGFLRRTVDHVKAVDGVSVTVREGHTVGVVGESGSGKTTLGMALLRLEQSDGAIVFRGRDIQGLTAKTLRPLRREMQVVFQDPYGSLSPRLSAARIIEEGLAVHHLGGTPAERRLMIDDAAGGRADPEAGTATQVLRRPAPADLPRAAMVLRPRLVVLDELTSALDMSVRRDRRSAARATGGSPLFISHDLRVVRALAGDVIVMRAGKVVEQGPTAEIFERPTHPYTKALMAAALDIEAVEGGTAGG